MDPFLLFSTLDLAFADIVLRILCGVLVGLCLGLTGVGGGVLIIPMLQLGFGMSPVLAVGTASLIAALVKVNAAWSHIRAQNVAWKPVFWVLLGSIPATLFTASMIVQLSNQPSYTVLINQVIEVLILAIMGLSLVTMIDKLRKEQRAGANSVQRTPSSYKAVASGALCGSVMGSTGIGGGVLLLPALNSVLGIDIKKAIGSSIVIALALSAISALKYSHGGQSDTVTAVLLFLGSLVGVPVAVRLVAHLDNTAIYKIAIGIIVLSLGLTLAF